MKSTRAIALCSIVAALTVAMMILGGVTGVMTYVVPFLGGLFLIPIREELSVKASLAVWIVASALGMLLCTDKELVAMYAIFFGWYGAAKPWFDKLPLSVIFKLIAFNAVIVAFYALMLKLIGAEAMGFGGKGLLIAALVLGHVTFLIYDRLLKIAPQIYRTKLRRKILPKSRR